MACYQVKVGKRVVSRHRKKSAANKARAARAKIARKPVRVVSCPVH